MKQLLQRVTKHPLHLLLGYVAILLGLILIFNDRYYFWPPYAAHFYNSDFTGAWGIFSGIGVTYVAAQPQLPAKANYIWLVSLSGFFGFETGLEFFHALVAANPHMLVTSLFLSGFLFLTFIVIRKNLYDERIHYKMKERDKILRKKVDHN